MKTLFPPQWGPFGDPSYRADQCTGLGILTNRSQCECFADNLWYTGIKISGVDCQDVSPTALFICFTIFLGFVLIINILKLGLLIQLTYWNRLKSRLSLVIASILLISTAFLLMTSLISMTFPFGLTTFRVSVLLFVLALSTLFFGLALYAGWLVIYFASFLSHPILQNQHIFRRVHFGLAIFFLLFTVVLFIFLFVNIHSQLLRTINILAVISSLLSLLCILVELAYILYAFWERFYRDKYNRGSYFSRSFRFIWTLHMLLLIIGIITFILSPVDYALFHKKGLTVTYFIVALAFVFITNSAALSTISDRLEEQEPEDEDQNGPVIFFPCSFCCFKICRGFSVPSEEDQYLFLNETK